MPFEPGRPEFTHWAGQACSKIRFAPDREKVKRELIAHMEDVRDAGIHGGESPEEAVRKAVQRMGDADTVALQLQRIYRPFWPFLWKYTRLLAGLAGIYLAWNLAVLVLLWGENTYGADDMAEYVTGGFVASGTTISDFAPEDSVKVQGYTISIERIRFKEGKSGYRGAYFVLKVFSFNPWQRQPFFYRNLTAVDDRGNVYPPRGVERNPEDREVTGNCASTGAFASYYEMWISNVDPEAQYFTLGFDDYGVQWSLSFPVEGGIEYEAS